MYVGESTYVHEETVMELFTDGLQTLDGSKIICKMFACIFVFFHKGLCFSHVKELITKT